MKHKTKIHLYLILFALFLIIAGCKKDLTPVDNTPPEIKLTVEDVGVTEAWLRLKIQYKSSKSQITISRNDSTINQFTNLNTDTLIYDSGLLPNHNYTYTVAILDAEPVEASASIEMTTMDTTSHDFTWELLTFGDGNSSVLRDVYIINSDDIWAVGEIYLNDSTGQIDPQPYGAIHWNGFEWELMKVPYHDYGTTIKYPGPLRTVFAFDSNNVYVTSSANLLKWDVDSWTEKAFFMTGIPFDGQVRKMWAGSENNIYCVGNVGAIYHYNGQNWQRIESGATQPITDIWGVKDSTTGENIIFALASNIYQGGEKKVLSISGNSVNEVNSDGLPWALSGVWFQKHQYYIVGDGLYKQITPSITAGWQSFHHGLANYYTNAIRGQGVNIVAAGSFGEIITFNGMIWKNHLSETYMSPGSFYSVDIEKNLIIAVGHKNYRACVLIGSRSG